MPLDYSQWWFTHFSSLDDLMQKLATGTLQCASFIYPEYLEVLICCLILSENTSAGPVTILIESHGGLSDKKLYRSLVHLLEQIPKLSFHSGHARITELLTKRGNLVRASSSPTPALVFGDGSCIEFLSKSNMRGISPPKHSKLWFLTKNGSMFEEIGHQTILESRIIIERELKEPLREMGIAFKTICVYDDGWDQVAKQRYTNRTSTDPTLPPWKKTSNGMDFGSVSNTPVVDPDIKPVDAWWWKTQRAEYVNKINR